MLKIAIAFVFAAGLLAASSAAMACDADTIQGLKDASSQALPAGKYSTGSQALINASHLELVCANETSGTESYGWAFRSAKDAALAAQAAHSGGMNGVAVQFIRTSTQLFQRLRPLAPSVGDRSTIDAELNANRALLQTWSKS